MPRAGGYLTTMDTSQVLELAIAFVLGIVASAVWDWLKGNITFRNSDYPDVKGVWNTQTALGGKAPFSEKIFVKSQFGRTFKGTFTSPDPEDPQKTVELEFDGFLIDKFTIRYMYRPVGGRFSDFGVGIVKLHKDYRHASGASVSIGISSDDPTTDQF